MLCLGQRRTPTDTQEQHANQQVWVAHWHARSVGRSVRVLHALHHRRRCAQIGLALFYPVTDNSFRWMSEDQQ